VYTFRYVGSEAAWFFVDAYISAFIPLSGTTTGNPVTGDIQLDAATGDRFIFSGDLSGDYKRIKWNDDDETFALERSTGGDITTFQIGNNSFVLNAVDVASKGLSGVQDYSANITDYDFTQKIYVDTVAPTVSSGSGAPGTTPTKIGDIYVDTSAPALYFSKGVASSADWIIV
jgi:hypothetical protein